MKAFCGNERQLAIKFESWNASRYLDCGLR